MLFLFHKLMGSTYLRDDCDDAKQHDEMKAYEGEVDEFLACTPDGMSGQLYAWTIAFSLTPSYRSLYGAQSGLISPKNSNDTSETSYHNWPQIFVRMT
jgi:hypothetical protein